jgi:outer membrane immunogenic protein
MGRSNFIAAAVAISAIAGISAASAADMPAHPWLKTDPVPVANPIYDWTGIYVGLEGGGTFGSSHQVLGASGLNTSNSYDVNGGLGGVTAGANWQTGLFVFGLEGDASWVGARGSSAENGPSGVAGRSDGTKEDWLATIRGRVGVAANNALFYGTAGYAVAGTSSTVFSPATGVVFDRSDDTRSGWTAGVGIEWGFLPDLTAKIEYLYVDLGNQPFNTINLGPASNRSSVPLTENIVRVGLNWRWGGPGTSSY